MAQVLVMGTKMVIWLQSEFLIKKGESIDNLLNWGIHLGEGEDSIHITIGLMLALLLALIITGLLIRVFSRLLTRNMSEEHKSKSISVIQFVKYLIYLVVVLITLSAGGIDITLLITASAALFVGLGLALTQFFQDVLGGIFIIIDKSLQIGDVVEIDEKVGKVFEIKLRTTRAMTRDEKVIIIPNHKFMSDVTFNYTQNYPKTREFVSTSVAYGSDVKKVRDVLIRCVKQENLVSKKHEPFVLFDDFGDSGLHFSVHFFISDSFKALKIKSNIRFRIEEEFRKNNITIPFPQRDIHLFQDVSAKRETND